MKDTLYLIFKLIYNLFRRTKTFFKYLSLRDVRDVFICKKEKGLKSAIHMLNETLLGRGENIYKAFNNSKCFRIVTPGHSVFVAKLMETEFRKLGIECEIVSLLRGKIPFNSKNRKIPHIIICPQIYSSMPPFYMAMQMEQTVSNRWLNSKYIRTLTAAHMVLDYSLFNIEYFGKRDEFSRNLFYYLPIDYLYGDAPDSSDCEKEIDVLFYGDDSAERRAKILKQLQSDFNIKIVNNLFGEDMLKLVRKSKIVLNIHYYEDALLEATRIYEVLSQNSSLIISERSADSFEDSRLDGIVDFVDIGDIEAIKKRLAYWLSHEEERAAKIKLNNEKLKGKKSDFSYFFIRALLANEIIDFETFYRHQKDYFSFEGERVCLGLPETVERSRTFMNDTHGFKLFPGLRHRLGWIGCGLSYKYLLTKALDENLEQIIICEDDTLFPSDFEDRLDKALKYLNEHDGEFDFFSGLISDSSNINLLDAFKYEGEQFFIPDKTVSTVLNVYMNSCFSIVSDWDYKNRDITKNTIDRYLQNKPLRILSMLPFLAEQSEDLSSSIWGFSNIQYRTLINESSEYFGKLIEKHNNL